MAAETPCSLGITADSLWECLPVRHAVVSWVGQAFRPTEAALVHESQEQAVFFLPSALRSGAA